jgi:hypothetical protein
MLLYPQLESEEAMINPMKSLNAFFILFIVFDFMKRKYENYNLEAAMLLISTFDATKTHKLYEPTGK